MEETDETLGDAADRRGCKGFDRGVGAQGSGDALIGASRMRCVMSMGTPSMRASIRAAQFPPPSVECRGTAAGGEGDGSGTEAKARSMRWSARPALFPPPSTGCRNAAFAERGLADRLPCGTALTYGEAPCGKRWLPWLPPALTAPCEALLLALSGRWERPGRGVPAMKLREAPDSVAEEHCVDIAEG